MVPELSKFDRPFLIEHNRLDETSKTFTPTARLHLTAQARTGGLLRELAGKESRMLLALMTYLTPNGEIRATATQVATALGIPTPVAALWLRQFAHLRFNGEPVVQRLKWTNGLTIYTLSQSLIEHDSQPAKTDPVIIHRVAGREAVIDHVRSTYATPRVEAERTVMHHLGLHPEELENTEDALIWRELRYLKIQRKDIQSLIEVFGTKQILQQLEWLPERRSKNRARTLVTSLIKNWGQPKRLHEVLRSNKALIGRNAKNSGTDEVTDVQEGDHD